MRQATITGRRQYGARSFGIMVILMGVLALVLAGCGSQSTSYSGAAQPTTSGNGNSYGATAPTQAASAPMTSTAASGSGAAGGESVVDVTVQEFSISPSQISVPAGKVKFVVTNNGSFTHDFVVKQGDKTVGSTPKFSKSQGAQTLEVTLEAGTYNVLCDVPGHADRGMTGTITVK